MTTRWTVVALGALAALEGAGCALTSKAEVMDVRTFSPEDTPGTGPAVPTPASAAAGPRLQLGLVTAAAHLRKKIVFRSSPLEIGVYDDRRWTERPEEYVRRSLSHSLYGQEGLSQSLESEAPALDVEVTAFEEVRGRGHSSGRVTLRYALHDEKLMFLSDTVTVEKRARSSDPRDVARAVSEALAAASSKVASAVSARLLAAHP